jgi:hypothetical protein
MARPRLVSSEHFDIERATQTENGKKQTDSAATFAPIWEVHPRGNPEAGHVRTLAIL